MEGADEEVAALSAGLPVLFAGGLGGGAEDMVNDEERGVAGSSPSSRVVLGHPARTRRRDAESRDLSQALCHRLDAQCKRAVRCETYASGSYVESFGYAGRHTRIVRKHTRVEEEGGLEDTS